MNEPQAPVHSRKPLPALLLLWLVLVTGYVVASVLGRHGLSTAFIGLMAGVLLWRAGKRAAAVGATALLLTVTAYWAHAVFFVAYLPPLAAFAFMAWFFGSTLRAGVEPLITRVARKERPDLPPDHERYTRSLTKLWAACFACMLLLALVSMPLLTLDSWTRWVHAMGYVLPAVLFLGEYLYRHRRFDDSKPAPIQQLIANIVLVIHEAATADSARTISKTASGHE